MVTAVLLLVVVFDDGSCGDYGVGSVMLIVVVVLMVVVVTAVVLAMRCYCLLLLSML